VTNLFINDDGFVTISFRLKVTESNKLTSVIYKKKTIKEVKANRKNRIVPSQLQIGSSPITVV